METTTLTIKASQKGMLASTMNHLIVAILFYYLFSLLGTTVQNTYHYHHVDSYTALTELAYTSERFDAKYLALFCTVGKFICLIILLGNILACIHNHLYSSRQINTIRCKDQDNWTVQCDEFGFPWSSSTTHDQFNRLVSVSTNQSTWERLLNTGSISIDVVTYVSGAVTENSFVFDGVSEPMAIKEQLLGLFRNHEGLLVEVSAKPA